MTFGNGEGQKTDFPGLHRTGGNLECCLRSTNTIDAALDMLHRIRRTASGLPFQSKAPSFLCRMMELCFIQLFFKALWIEQEVVDVYGQDAIFIVVWLHNILGNDDFLKRIINLSERPDFLNPFCFVRQ